MAESSTMVLFELDHSFQTATICLNNPQTGNALNMRMAAELSQMFWGLYKPPEAVRSILLKGAGESFCAGIDEDWLRQTLDYGFEQNVEEAHALARLFRLILDCPRPVIAQVHGTVATAGIGFISACDMTIAHENAVFAFSEARLGLLPAIIAPFVIRRIGEACARRYFLTGESFTAQDALTMGLISAIAEDEASMARQVRDWQQAIAANGPEAVAQSKTLIAQVCHMDWNRAVDITTKMFAERRVSREGQEGMRAFLEKRLPSWQPPPV